MTGEFTDHPRPMPRFRFDVSWGTVAQNLSFSAVSGLQVDKDVQPSGIVHRLHAKVQKALGLRNPGRVTLRNVIFPSDRVLSALYKQVKEKEVIGQTVVINLLNEDGQAVITWTLKNAWVSKLSFSDLRSDANELAEYSVEVVHDGIELAVAGAD